MITDKYKTDFKCSGKTFTFLLHSDNHIVFYRYAGVDFMGYDNSPTALRGDNDVNTIAVFRKVVDIVKNLYYTKQMNTFWFKCDDEKRISLYTKLGNRVAKDLGLTMTVDTMTGGACFYFY